MDNAAYIALSRQKILYTAMDNVANNVANANTNGFKSESMIFQQYLMDNLQSGEKMAFVQDVATYTDNQQGGLTNTERKLDVAINGEGYFPIETPLGIRYTRLGNFHLNIDGLLVTKNGHYVLGNAGERIALAPDDVNINISRDGTIDVEGEIRGQIGVTAFEDNQYLNKLGNGLYQYEENTGFAPFPANNFDLAQGMLEQSNVNSIQEITRMIQVTRAVGTTSGFINDIGELQRRAVDTIASTK